MKKMDLDFHFCFCYKSVRCFTLLMPAAKRRQFEPFNNKALGEFSAINNVIFY